MILILKNIRSNIYELFQNNVKKDKFLNDYSTLNEIDFIDVIQKSSFDIVTFTKVCDAIIENDETDMTITFHDNIHTNIENINATFQIFQILKIFGESHKFFWHGSESNVHIITQSMLHYFQAVFKKRTNLLHHVFNENILTSYLENKDTNWSDIDINIYFIFEQFNLPSSYESLQIFKTYLINRTNILLNKPFHQIYTLEFLNKLMGSCGQHNGLYIYYEILKYINIVYDTNVLYLTENTISSLLNHTKDIKKDVDHILSNCPKFFEQNINKEIDCFISTAESYMFDMINKVLTIFE